MKLDAIANKLVTTFGDRETEQNWEKIDGLLKELATKIVDEGGNLDELLACVRKSRDLSTERTRLALTGLDLLQKIATAAGPAYESLQDWFLFPVLRLCERTNRVIADRAKATLLVLMKFPHPIKVVMTRLLEAHSSQNRALRLCVVEAARQIIKESPQESFGEFEQALTKILTDGLQDAAETVRLASRQAYPLLVKVFPAAATVAATKCPPSIIKSLSNSIGNSSTPTGARPNFRSFLQAKRGPPQAEAKSSGPQRVIQKNPLTTTNQSLAQPSRFASSAINLPSHQQQQQQQQQSTMAKLSSSTNSETPSSQMPIRPVKGHSTSSLSLPKFNSSTIIGTTTATITAVSPFPQYRRLVGDFKEKLGKSFSWDARCATIDGFVAVLDEETFQRDIQNSKASKLDLFEIYLAGLSDVHHRVVQSTLNYGKKLLLIIPSDKHPNPTSFVTAALGRLFKVLYDVQFKTRSQLLDAARDALAQLEVWIGSANAYFVCFVDFLLKDRPGSYVRLKRQTYEKATELLSTGKVCFDDALCKLAANAIRRLGTYLNDPEDGIKDAVARLIESLARYSGLCNWLGMIPPEYREIMEGFISQTTCQEVTVLPSPITLPIEVDLSIKVHRMDEIVVDEEISLKVKGELKNLKLPPATPKQASIINVDFDTPRSMNHEPLIPSDDDDHHHHDTSEDELKPQTLDEDSTSSDVRNVKADANHDTTPLIVTVETMELLGIQ